MEQGKLIIQLKEMIRERETTLKNKEAELKVSKKVTVWTLLRTPG